MELPAEVLIHNTQLGMKGGHGRLLRIGEDGYYEVSISFGENKHRALLPIADTVLIVEQPEEAGAAIMDVER